MHQPSRSLRPIRLLRMLRQGGRFSLVELATSFSMCERTVQRDLLLLKKAGFDIQFDAGTKTYRFAGSTDAASPRSLPNEHARLLATAARSSPSYASPNQRLAIETAIAALLNGESTSVMQAETTAGAFVFVPRSILAELGRSLVQRRAVKTTIEHPTTGWEWRLTLVPLQLVVAGDKPALLAKSPHQTDLFLIDLETIRIASTTEETYDVEEPDEAAIADAQRLF